MSMIPSAVVNIILKRIADLLEEKVCMIWDVVDELKKLLRRLERLKNYLEDAESKGIQDTPIRTWLGELKDVMYDAEDIIDLCRIEGRLLEEDNLLPISSVRCQFPLISCFTGTKFRYDIAEQIKALNGRLKEIAEDSSILSRLANRKPPQATVLHKTSPVLAESDIVGQDIEEGTQRLVKSLTKEDDGQKCSIFAILGMGGIGKTTLARKVYNHTMIIDNFTILVWVCVSRSYSETDLLKEIIRGAGGVCGEASSLAELETKLVSVLSGKFLLILDDVWEASVWENLLRTPLESCGAASVRILVTTRYETVARNLRAVAHNVEKMNSSDGWLLLCKKVFGDRGEEEDILALKNVGIQIVNKCDGLPLAIKAIAGVLRSKETSTKEWKKVLGNHAWSMAELPEELRGALYLSYEDLSSNLKQCFLYCSLFPEDYLTDSKDVIQFWVAEGFIRSEDEEVIMEDLAEEYYHELIERNILQQERINMDKSYFKMHDMFRSLAQFLIGEESICFVGGPATLNDSTLRKLRRVSFAKAGKEALQPFTTTGQQRCLRTLIFFHTPSLQLLDNNLFDVLGYLRVLDLCDTGIESLPDSVGKLVHLRYLDLDRTRIKQLPETIRNLVCLQTLCLSECESLHTLPKGITRLCNLRCLTIRKTPLSHIPKGLGQMKQLNRLEGFSAGDDAIGNADGQPEGCNMEELQNLSQLRCLSIHNLQRATKGTLAVTNKPFLKELHLYFCPSPPGAGDGPPPPYVETTIQRMEKVMEELFPPPSLEQLDIDGFPGRGYPNWMLLPSTLRTSFPHLESVFLDGLKSCAQLPPLGQLPALKFLRIAGGDAVVKVGPEFFGYHSAVTARVAFPRLETLRFKQMLNWEEWLLGEDEEGGDWRRVTYKLLPRLKKLCLLKCPSLRYLPPGLQHATSLETLLIRGAHSMQKVNNLPWLTELLQVDDCCSLQSIYDLPALQRLTINNCPHLTCAKNLDALHHLYLDHGGSLSTESTQSNGSANELYVAECLPGWLGRIVETLQLQRTQASTSNALPVPDLQFRLKCSPFQLARCLPGGDNWPVIEQIPQVYINTYDGSEFMAYTRTPPSCRANLVIRRSMDPDQQPDPVL